MGYKKPPLHLQVTSLWEYPSQHYGQELQGDPNYRGATPSYVIWNLLQRYTQPGELVVDPCAGSGTTLDVAADLGRQAKGFDVMVGAVHPKNIASIKSLERAGYKKLYLLKRTVVLGFTKLSRSDETPEFLAKQSLYK